jgi:hypothetical protein
MPRNSAYIGGVGSPALERLGIQTGRIPSYAPYARRFLDALEGSYGPSETVLPQITQYAEQAASGGITPEERLHGERRIGERYRSAVAGPVGRGAAAGRFSPGLVSRTGALEASRTLAPAQGAFEAGIASRRQEGLRTALGALGGIYPSQAAAEERRRTSYGQFLGDLVREPTFAVPSTGTGRGGYGFRGGSA